MEKGGEGRPPEMGKPTFRWRLRSAACDLRARLSASPDIWTESAWQDQTKQANDVADWLKIPIMFPASDGDPYRHSTDLDLERSDDELHERLLAAWEPVDDGPGVTSRQAD